MPIVEKTTLPTITAAAKGSEWTGYVNAYVLDKRREQMTDGNYRQGLWYLSYVLPKGQGAVGAAIFNSFVSNAGRKQFFLEGVGYITLGSHRQDLVKLNYKVHWNQRLEHISPEATQYIIEPLMLTSFDPMAIESRSHHKKGGKGKGKGKQKGEASLSTAPSTQSFEDEEGEATRREQKPMFLLLVPEAKKDDEAYLQALHWTYLRKRCPFDLCEEWAPFLWERASREGEVKELETWCYTYQPSPKEEDFTIPSAPSSSSSKEEPVVEEESPFQAVLSRAYLCLPNIEGIHKDLLKNVTQDEAKGREREEVAA